jgi:membrane-bound lytic murein transglycosylase A
MDLMAVVGFDYRLVKHVFGQSRQIVEMGKHGSNHLAGSDRILQIAGFALKRRLVLSRLLSFIAVFIGATGALVWLFWTDIAGFVGWGEVPEKPADALTLSAMDFNHLDGWQSDDMRGSLKAFQRSCAAMIKRSDDRDIGPDPRMGTVGDWRGLCETALALEPDTIRKEDARTFFQTVAGGQ